MYRVNITLGCRKEEKLSCPNTSNDVFLTIQTPWKESASVSDNQGTVEVENGPDLELRNKK